MDKIVTSVGTTLTAKFVQLVGLCMFSCTRQTAEKVPERFVIAGEATNFPFSRWI
jgi:hypothetical protein